MIVRDTWAQWMTTVLDEIVAHVELQDVLYTYQREFFQEDVYHRDISKDHVRSNEIKQYLHEIMTNAIFNWCPGKDLVSNAKKAVDRNRWSSNEVFWLSLNAAPFSRVSKYLC